MSDPIDLLDRPIDWRQPALWPILGDLQGNILKGHGRDHTQNIFLRLERDRIDTVRRAIRDIGTHVTSALEQLRATETYKLLGRSGGTMVQFMLSAAGYRAIGLTPPSDPAFVEGMAARSADLGDPAAAAWEAHLRDVHAVVLIADDSDTLVANAGARLETGLVAAGITVLGRDAGRALRRPPGAGTGKGDGVEHFGYVDGRSQPLLLADDVADEQQSGATVWDPAFSPREAALVRDPHGAFAESFGSYFVYRKLEQDVAGFKRREEALADALGLAGNDRDRAGAMVVGRFEDGSPLVDTSAAGAGAINDFDYAGDADATRCPFQAHIRKTNPRGDTVRRFGLDPADERAHLMPRRGIPYGERADLPDLKGPYPSVGVGLLFMAYSADIARQFEFTQASWANNPDFVRPGAGPDPVIGLAGAAGADQPQPWRSTYGSPAGAPVDFPFGQFVTMKGGEYFFAPSLSALAAL